ncbi:MAG: hypothetical protein CM15mP106_3390 [Candidatus Neomarinimicrobiota bacterium]|nr:MAG: hypothetical protein CM15mP106_3390 [Candidatus Neomarinimicrobiota bacterium]
MNFGEEVLLNQFDDQITNFVLKWNRGFLCFKKGLLL